MTGATQDPGDQQARAGIEIQYQCVGALDGRIIPRFRRLSEPNRTRPLRGAADRAVEVPRDRRRRAVPVDPRPWDLAHRPEVGLKPPAERRIVHRRTYLDVPLDTVSAVRDLLDIDAEFLLFVHTWTNEDVVVYLRDDARIGLLYPEGSRLADEGDVVVPKASRYPGPLELSEARTEMDFLDHRFLYFTDAADERGKVIYLRRDGDYGLVEPQ